MNRKAILALLFSHLSKFNIHPRLIEEVLEIITGSGYEQKFFKLLTVRLEFLSRYGPDAICLHEEFELIQDGVFSMHLSQRGFNIRILYSFLPNGTPCLLSCFYERGGKSKTDYTPHIRPAMERFKERLEVYENG